MNLPTFIKHTILALHLGVLGVIALPLIAQAAAPSYNLLIKLEGPQGTGIQSAQTVTSPDDLAKYLEVIFKIVVGFSGLIAVTVLIIGGIEYVSSGIAGNEALRAAAHKRIWDALKGLLLTFGGYLILFTINPQLTTFDLKLEPVQYTPDAVNTPPPAYNTGGNAVAAPQIPALTGGVFPEDAPVNPTVKQRLAYIEYLLCGGQDCLRVITTQTGDPDYPRVQISATNMVNEAMQQQSGGAGVGMQPTEGQRVGISPLVPGVIATSPYRFVYHANYPNGAYWELEN